jgi:hypothetical protein
MAITASQVIDGALEMAAPWGQGPTNIVYKSLLTYLGSLDMEIVSVAARVNKSLLGAAGTELTVAQATNVAGYTLAAGALAYYDFQWVDEGGSTIPIRIVPDARFDDPPLHPAGVVRDAKFYPCDPCGKRWTETCSSYFHGSGDAIRYRYVALPSALTAKSSVLASPDMALLYFQLKIRALVQAINGAPRTVVESSFFDAEKARQQLGLNIMTQSEIRDQYGSPSYVGEAG